jgi:hypothetical protein
MILISEGTVRDGLTVRYGVFTCGVFTPYTVGGNCTILAVNGRRGVERSSLPESPVELGMTA